MGTLLITTIFCNQTFEISAQEYFDKKSYLEDAFLPNMVRVIRSGNTAEEYSNFQNNQKEINDALSSQDTEVESPGSLWSRESALEGKRSNGALAYRMIKRILDADKLQHLDFGDDPAIENKYNNLTPFTFNSPHWKSSYQWNHHRSIFGKRAKQWGAKKKKEANIFRLIKRAE